MPNHKCAEHLIGTEEICEHCLELAELKFIATSPENGVIIIHSDGHGEFILPPASNEKVIAIMRKLYTALEETK